MTTKSFVYDLAKARLNVLFILFKEKDPAHFQSLKNVISLLEKDLQGILNTRVYISSHNKKIPFQIYDKNDTRHIRFAIGDELDFEKVLSTLCITIVIACCTNHFISEEIDPHSFELYDFMDKHADLYSLAIELTKIIMAKHRA